ncbi:MAG TPA: hypothetical protein VHW09_05330 [Bryobacteraceae bacterium]|jgi:hypothetical protein|nr:hypothetical protein [Bryobacteraceae bacterium]
MRKADFGVVSVRSCAANITDWAGWKAHAPIGAANESDAGDNVSLQLIRVVSGERVAMYWGGGRISWREAIAAPRR